MQPKFSLIFASCGILALVAISEKQEWRERGEKREGTGEGRGERRGERGERREVRGERILTHTKLLLPALRFRNLYFLLKFLNQCTVCDP